MVSGDFEEGVPEKPKRPKRVKKPASEQGRVLPIEIENALVPIGCAITDEQKLGRPALWNQEMADQICAYIITGDTLVKICARADMPSVTTVVKWLRERPSFALAYARAREDQADTFADMMITIAFESKQDWIQDPDTGQWKPDHDVVQRARLKVDTLKWVASKLKPKTYGDRVEARVTGADGGKLVVENHNVNLNIDASKMGADARELLRSAVLGAMSTPAAALDPEPDEEDS